VEPGYGVELFEDDHLLLLPAADLRMDPALRPRPVSSVAFAYLGNALQLDHSIERRIFRVHRFSVVIPARLHRSDFIFRFYVYGGTFDGPPGYLLSARRTVFGGLCADGSFGYVRTTGVLSASVSDFMVWDGGLSFSGIS
jgi:hypothetical protein